jgi:hypothetical protein
VTRTAVLARIALIVGGLAAACARSGGGPRLADGPRRAELGKLWLGEERVHEFPCRNEGDAPLALGEVRSTCGCLIAGFTPSEVAPGTERRLPVTFRADKSLGPVVKELRVATNDPAHPWLALELAADVTALYSLDPPLVTFKEVVLGDPASARVTIGVADGSAVRFETPVVEEPGFTAAWVDDARRQLEVRCEGRGRVGGHLFSITLPGDHPRVKNALVPVSATLVARLEFPDGDRVDFGDVERTRGATRRVRVRQRGKTPLAADHPEAAVVLAGSAAGAAPAATRWSIDETGRAWTLEVALPAQARALPLVGRIDVTLPGTDEPPHALTLAGRVVDR